MPDTNILFLLAQERLASHLWCQSCSKHACSVQKQILHFRFVVKHKNMAFLRKKAWNTHLEQVFGLVALGGGAGYIVVVWWRE